MIKFNNSIQIKYHGIYVIHRLKLGHGGCINCPRTNVQSFQSKFSRLGERLDLIAREYPLERVIHFTQFKQCIGKTLVGTRHVITFNKPNKPQPVD